MKFLWKLKRAFMKDLINQYPEPKPASTTIATLIKRMRDKKVVDYKLYGNSREYFPLISKQAYFEDHLQGLIKNHFDDSAAQFASFFANSSKLTPEQLKELRKLIDDQIDEAI